MNWGHPQKKGRRVRLAYCQNLHAAETLDETIAGIRAITLPLRERTSPAIDEHREASAFGVGLYLPATVARELASNGNGELDRFADFLGEHALDPFTYNAFPYGGFHRAGLKAGVFRPTWEEEERVAFTLDVARVAAELPLRLGRAERSSHVSISTHSGRFGAFALGTRDADERSARACARNLARVVDELARIERDRGVRVILALEPEPRASAGDGAELALFLERAWSFGAADLAERRSIDRDAALASMHRHLGTCLDLCHAAVEFESDAVAHWSASGAALGKVQFSSALALKDPARNRAGVEALLALDEPRYLHQVTGASGAGRLRADDLPDLAAAVARDDGQWRGCSEWRCHFHVPVDLESLATNSGARADGAPLATTRAEADRMLDEILALDSWRPAELQVEIETYTWDILPGVARGAGSLVDGLEREYAHVMSRLERAGWRRE